MQRCVTCRAPTAHYQHHPVPGSAAQEPQQRFHHLTVPTKPGICFKVGDVGVGRFENNDLTLEEWERGTARAVGGLSESGFCESSMPGADGPQPLEDEVRSESDNTETSLIVNTWHAVE